MIELTSDNDTLKLKVSVVICDSMISNEEYNWSMTFTSYDINSNSSTLIYIWIYRYSDIHL